MALHTPYTFGYCIKNASVAQSQAADVVKAHDQAGLQPRLLSEAFVFDEKITLLLEVTSI